MNRWRRWGAGLVGAALLGWIALAGAEPGTVFQASTIEALLNGGYGGETTLARLAEAGDFGLGTVDRLDGELVVLDGGFYQVRVDGSVHRLSHQTTTPFAVVVPFAPQRQLTLPVGETLASLESRVAGWSGGDNHIAALRVEGSFERVRVRSVPRQTPPFRRLAEVVQEQREFVLESLEGTLVGFRFPAYAKGINVPGFHFHFLAKDRQSGGHVLDFRLNSGELAAMEVSGWRIELPDSPAFRHAVLGGEARQDELRQVEKRVLTKE
ncbi:MAG: acetolactate decarboxylase [Magnetococcales bacterium]|nr:acetolactate decarboxylase [Magnetococcales bacterium]